MADLPKVNPVNIVMESEKYYDFDPSSFKNVLPTLKTVGGGIADILIPQDAPEFAMMAVPPLAVYKRVEKILNQAAALKAQAQSLYKYAARYGGSTSGAKMFERQAKQLVDDIPKKDKKIHNDYAKSISGTKESNQKGADKARRILSGVDEEPDAANFIGAYSSKEELMQSYLKNPGTIPYSPGLKRTIKKYLQDNPQKVENLQLSKNLKRTKLDDLLDNLDK
jgi:hypothetical protein